MILKEFENKKILNFSILNQSKKLIANKNKNVVITTEDNL